MIRISHFRFWKSKWSLLTLDGNLSNVFIHPLHLYYQPSNGCLIYQLMCRSTQADWAADPSTLNGVQTISNHLGFVFSRTEERSTELKMAQVCNLESTKLWTETFDKELRDYWNSMQFSVSTFYTCGYLDNLYRFAKCLHLVSVQILLHSSINIELLWQ